MLKRSREDKTHCTTNNNKNGHHTGLTDFNNLIATTVANGTGLVSHELDSGKSTNKQQLINPTHTKIVQASSHLPPRPCTPRYPIKPLNGVRKLRSRNTLVKSKTNKSMVVPIPARCATPSTIVGGTTTTTSAATGNNSLDTTSSNADGDESDTGCSSLDDDDDFDGKKKISIILSLY